MAKAAKVPCPVCRKPLHPKGGLQGHLASAKDSDHTAYRAKAQAAPKGEPQAPAKPAPPPGPVNPAPQQEEKGGVKGPVQVTFTPAVTGVPLLPPEQETKPAGQAPAGSPPATVDPKAKGAVAIAPGALAPVINGGVAVMCNGFFLRGEGDGQLTPEEVATTGFGESLEKAVRHYFPNLPWDHPAVLLFVSTAGLSMVVASKKAPKGQDAPKPVEKPKDAQEPKALSAQATPPAEAPAEPPVDDYWRGIQAQAGGVPSGGEVVAAE